MGAAEQPGMNDVGMQATRDSRPFHRVYVDGFWMDATEVTNAQFAKFVEATKYVTIAERTPRAGGFSRRAAGESRPRRRRLLAARSSGAAERSLSVVVVCEGRELASSRWPGEYPGRP